MQTTHEQQESPRTPSTTTYQASTTTHEQHTDIDATVEAALKRLEEALESEDPEQLDYIRAARKAAPTIIAEHGLSDKLSNRTGTNIDVCMSDQYSQCHPACVWLESTKCRHPVAIYSRKVNKLVPYNSIKGSVAYIYATTSDISELDRGRLPPDQEKVLRDSGISEYHLIPSDAPLPVKAASVVKLSDSSWFQVAVILFVVMAVILTVAYLLYNLKK